MSALIVSGVLTASALASAQTPPFDAPPPGASDAAAAGGPPVTYTSPPPAPPPAPSTSVKVDGQNANIKFGLLAQPQYEAVGAPLADGMQHNLFLRRIRILVGGTLFGQLDYFLDTDYANLFKNNAVGGAMATPGFKNTPGLNIQDAFITYRPLGDLVKVDVGYMLPPLAHNALQGATTLYSLDYFSYSFAHSNAFGTSADPIGRDLGVQVRGLVLDGRLEYRVGMFQGLRNAPVPAMPGPAQVGGRNFFRVAARLQLNLLDAETGFFYAGSYLGAKKLLSIGASFDFQGLENGYRYWAVDAIADLPLGPGALTAQVNLAQWNAGDTAFLALAKQTAIMGEAGYRLAAPPVGPIIRVEHRWGSGAVVDETRFALGGAFWWYQHNSNLKAFYTRVAPSGGGQDAYNQFNLQWQVYFY
ncbi:MAG: porin [Pseudomonadota bacterium]